MIKSRVAPLVLMAWFECSALASDITVPLTPEGGAEKIDIETLSLQDLLNGNVDVVLQKKARELETPGIVTVVTHDEIVTSGARDLLDVFQLIPGLNVSQDDFGIVSLSVRGMWAQEGKVLLLWDGQEMNERGRGTNEYGNRFPLEQIERIEVIRGPGSITYGQFAELAVINIITHKAQDIDGATAAAYYGQGTRGLGQRDVSVELGKKFQDLKVSLGLFVGQGQRSDRTYSDLGIPPLSYSMAGNSALNPLFVNLGVQYKDLQFRFIYDNFNFQSRDYSGPVNPQPYTFSLAGFYTQLKYDWHLGDRLTLSPSVSFKSQEPYDLKDPSAPYYFNIEVQHYEANLLLSYEPLENLSLVAGLQAYTDVGIVNAPYSSGGPPPYPPGTQGTGFNFLWPNGTNRYSLWDVAVFAQATYTTGFLGNLTLGARSEYQSLAGVSEGLLVGPVPFIPRLALTKIIHNFHFKILASEAFRASTLENVAIATTPPNNTLLKPEQTTVYEGEVGYEITRDQYLAANIFDIHINRPIIFGNDPSTGDQSYFNSVDPLVSYGFEVVYRVKYGPHFLNANYSFYSTIGRIEDALYTGPQKGDSFLAAPAHKVSVHAGIALTPDLSFNPSFVFLSSRYGYAGLDALGNAQFNYSGNAFLVNLFLTYRNIGAVKGLDAGVGVYNLLNQGYGYTQAYAAGHAQLPAMSRELIGRLTYHLPW